MARLRNTRTGVVVNVDDGTASGLDSEWEPVEAEKPRRAPKKSSDEK